MRSILVLLRSLGSAGAMENARVELELDHVRRLQAAMVARRVGAGDPTRARHDARLEARAVAVPTAA